MTTKRVLLCLAVTAALTNAPLASADVTVWFNPASPTVAVGETVDVDLMASFDSPVIGWGMDMVIDAPLYADWIDTTIGGAWDATSTLDGDGLAGLRFPDGVSGDVLLATLTIQGLAVGETSLTLSSGPEEDEGFLLALGGLDTNVMFTSSSLVVVPEPGSIALMCTCALATVRRRR